MFPILQPGGSTNSHADFRTYSVRLLRTRWRSIALLAAFSTGLLLLIPIYHARAAKSNTIQPPPPAPVRPVTEDYFGTKVVDPYRYMEDLKNPEVEAWFKAQNDYTRAVLASIPGRDSLLARIT